MSEEQKISNQSLADLVQVIDSASDQDLASKLAVIIGADFDESAIASEDLNPVHLLVRFALAEKPASYSTLANALPYLNLNGFEAYHLELESYTNCISTTVADDIQAGKSSEFIHVDEDYHAAPLKSSGPFAYYIQKVTYETFKAGCAYSAGIVRLNLPLDACDESDLSIISDSNFCEKVTVADYGQATRDPSEFTVLFALDKRVQVPA